MATPPDLRIAAQTSVTSVTALAPPGEPHPRLLRGSDPYEFRSTTLCLEA
jgi:hypothetical protein